MFDVHDVNEKRKALQQSLVDLFVLYVGKYMRHIYNSITTANDAHQVLRKKLLHVSLWDETKQHKEYKKFLKWCSLEIMKKSNTQTVDDIINENLYQFTLYSVYIVLEGYEVDYSELDIKVLSGEELFNKILCRAARMFYDKPSVVVDKALSKSMLMDVVEDLLYSNIPMGLIIDIILKKNQSNSVLDDTMVLEDKVFEPIIIEKEEMTNHIELQYFGPTEIEKHVKACQPQNDSEGASDNEKQIVLPALRKRKL